MDIKRRDIFCSDCMSPSSHGFKKVLALKNSGLLIYLHVGEESKKHSTLEEMKKNAAEKSKQLGIFILHNDSEHDLRRPDYAIEMCQLRTRCFRCINVVKRVRSLLGELNFIKKNQVIGLCDHCKRNPGACKRCQYIVNKFLDNKSELHMEKQEQFNSWLGKLNQFLHYVLDDENVDRGQINNDPSALELEILLQELKRPLQLRRLHTTFFPTDLAQLSSMTEGNDMIDELIAKIKPEDLKKPELDEDLPPVSEGMQLLPKEHQKAIPGRLPPLTRTMQKKRLHEWIGKNKASENQSEDNQTDHHRISSTKGEKNKSISETTTLGSTPNLVEKDNTSKKQFKDIPRNVTESHRKKETKKEHKSISEMTSKGSTSNILEKDNASENQSKDKQENVIRPHRKKEIKKDKNKVISESISKGSTSKPLEKYNASKRQSEAKSSNVRESHKRKDTKKEQHKTTPEITNKGSTSNLLEKDNVSKTQYKDSVSNATETHGKKATNTDKKDKNKAITEISKDSILTVMKKSNASKTQSKDNLSNVTDIHRKKATKKDKNKAISEKSKDFTSNLLEKDNALETQSEVIVSNVPENHIKKAIKNIKNKAISETTTNSSSKQYNKDNATKNKSKDKSGNVIEPHRRKETKIEKNILVSETPIKESITKLLRKKLKDGDGEENKNSEATQEKESERKDEKKAKKSLMNQPVFSSDRDIDIVKLIKIYNRTKKRNTKDNKKSQNTTNPYANVELQLPSVNIEEYKDFFSFDSFVECGQQNPDLITKMIKRTKLVKYAPQSKENNLTLSEAEENLSLPNLFVNTAKETQIKKSSSAGVLRYNLSDKTFISKGYTVLPVIKVMKRFNIYKMEPENPQFNWFERNKDVGTKNYDTGEILAEIKQNGTGRWFYKNGRIALDYYNAEDVTAGQRYVLYSSGEERNQQHGAGFKELKNKHQVLGVFDLIGNGAVYDFQGNERVKYNQTEGIVFDSKIGPLGHWKWHSLNEPPVLEPVLIDNYDPSFCIAKLKHSPIDHTEKPDKRYQNPEVLQTELHIFAKQKADKMLQKYKPYQIRMKAFKVNDMFSLRIIDQANIYLLFRHGTISMKLNLGLKLVSNEIVDTDTSEVGGVVTPYDRIPPRTSSVANIQRRLRNIRNLYS